MRKVVYDAQRDRLVSNVVGILKIAHPNPVLERAFDYWRNIDEQSGERIVKGVKGK